MTKAPASERRMDALYSELQPQLLRIVSSNLQAPEGLIEDACQTAWSALLSRPGAVAAGAELGWLSTTAMREALRLLRDDRVDAPLDELPEPTSLDAHRPPPPGPQDSLELRERLAEIRRLPLRQQRMVWLQGLGYEYVEIAAATGDSCRTVERQLARARQRLARLGDE